MPSITSVTPFLLRTECVGQEIHSSDPAEVMRRVEDALVRVGSQKRARNWQCPAHEDVWPSLSVAMGRRAIIMHCHAGCDTREVLARLGLQMSDLFYERSERSYRAELVRAPARPKGQPVKMPAKRVPSGMPVRLFRGDGEIRPTAADPSARYNYVDADGCVLYQVLRGPDKLFVQRRRDGERWIYNMQGVKPVPYRRQSLATGISRGETIYIVEGEKDVQRLETCGYRATTNHGGANGFRPELAPYFAGAHVVIIPDNDPAGRVWADTVCETIRPVARTVRIVRLAGLPPHGDVSDWLESHRADELSAAVTR